MGIGRLPRPFRQQRHLQRHHRLRMALARLRRPGWALLAAAGGARARCPPARAPPPPAVTGPASAATASAFVRVNLVGYASGLPKRAYLMSSVSETGATFAVKDSGGNSVLVGPVGSSVGKWSKDFRN